MIGNKKGVGHMANIKKVRRTSESSQKDLQSNDLLLILKGSILSVIITIICFIIFAFIMKIGNLHEDIISPVNQVIRIISIVIGSAIAARASNNKGWLKGAATGILYMIWAVLISFIFENQVKFDSILLSDMALGLVVGAIGGIIGINLK